VNRRAGAPGGRSSRCPTRCSRASPARLSRRHGIVIALLLVLAALPCRAAAQSAQPPFDLKDPGIVEGGRILFNLRCAGRCHGLDGRDGFDGPALVGKVYLDPVYGWATLTTGRPGSAMPSFQGRFTDDEFWKLVAFMSWLGDQARKGSP
jgi:mono/diheme cytochrome c family protein